ncbi:histidine phosphatase family protein [Clostridium perfringens]|uniref:histidine phosphatase family protein n=1 Tax=Clostridium perfringens TaxID=1502 RepID=UPI0034A24EBF
MKSIITIQHTESIHHTNGMVGSWTDWDLSELGIKQANNIGRNLSKELENKKYVMYSSDLLRAKHTAKIIGKYLGVEPILVRELRERNLGRCVGKSVKWLKENIEKEEKSIDDKMFSDAESRRDEWNRLLPFFNELMASEHENIIIVSHGDLLSVFNSMWLGMEVEMLNKSELFGLAGGVTFMEETASGKRFMKRMSDMSYVNDYTALQ